MSRFFNRDGMRSLMPLLAYILLTVSICGWSSKTGEIFQRSPDAIAFTWFLNWWPFAIGHGINPSFTDYVGAPVGHNLWWVTSIPTLAVLGWPITALAGPIATWNVLSLLSIALSAYACFWLLLYLSRSQLAAFAGGLIFGFSTYQTGQLMGHICLTFLPLIPLMILLAVMRARREVGRVRFIVLMSLCAALQFGVSSEVLATFGLFAAIGFVCFYPFYFRTADMNGLAIDLAASVVLSVIAVSPALLSMYLSRATVPEVLRDGTFFSSDLLNFVIPNPYVWIGGQQFEWLARKFTGGYVEEGAYLGVPLILVALWAAWAHRRARWLPPLLIVLTCAILLTLGPILQVGGAKTGIPLPWALVERVPVIRNALPMRLTMYVSLIVAVLVAMLLAGGVGRFGNVAKLALVGLGFAMLLPNPKNFGYSPVDKHEAFTPAAVDRLIGRGSTIVTLPYGQYGNSSLWQLDSGMSFKIAGGYLGPVPLFFSSSPGWHALNYGPKPKNEGEFENDINAFVAATNTSAIVVTSSQTHASPDVAAALRREILALPWERTTEGDAVIMKVPPRESLKFITVRGDTWGQPQSEDFWIGKRVEVENRTATARTVTLSRAAAPSELGALNISATIAGVTKVHQIVGNQVVIEVPPNSIAVVAVDKTWVPHASMRNGDYRSLSITMRVNGWEPARSDPAAD